MNETFYISDFTILTTGNDGGHRYVETHTIYEGHQRRMTVFFAAKLDEAKLDPAKPFTARGIVQDDGVQYGLIVRDAKIME